MSTAPLDSSTGTLAPETPPQSGGKRPTSHAGWVLVAFHASCDKKDLEVAGDLLTIFEAAARADLDQPGERRRHALDLIVAAHERLWLLKHPLDAVTAL